MKREYKSAQETFAVPTGNTPLPINQPIAIYYRQSTDAQIGNISTSLQTVDMVSYLQRCGWADGHILMIDMDGGISGSTKIDERPGMSQLFDLINRGEISAVACQDEDRLFRDVTQIQVNIFIEACRSSNVLVLTPSMVYDFANELTGTFHARQFRFKSEMAADYISSVIRGKLHRAKRRLQMEGRWAGGGIPVGFMVDMRKTLRDGSKNPDWRRYVPFDMYLEVVQEYFQLFLSFAGNQRATLRHIHEHGPFYPDPATNPPPPGYKVHYKIHRYGNGFAPGRMALSIILTNAAYIGHWAVNDVIVRWNNHPAIIDEGTFYQAFNYLAEKQLDGTPNPHYQPLMEHARPTVEESREVERPLCSGMIVSFHQGEWRNVGTNWNSKYEHYSYALWETGPHDTYIWGKRAVYVDRAITRMLHRKLRATFDQEVWAESMKKFTQNFEKERGKILAQLKHLEQVMDNLVASLETLKNPTMIQRTESRYEEAQAEHKRLMTELKSMDNEQQRMAALENIKEACGPILENWPSMTREEKRVVLRVFIQRIEANPVEGHGLHLVIQWKDETSNEMTLPRQATTGNNWLPEETALLLKMIEENASQVEIAQAFPKRKWKYVDNKIRREYGQRFRIRPKPIMNKETYFDYLERTGQMEELEKVQSLSEFGFSRSFRNKTPRCDRLISPGRGQAPPPTSPA